jgi:hypothetical protein
LSGDHPIREAAHGATAAGIEWTEEKVKSLAKQFLNRKLAFIESPRNIDLVKRERHSAEYELLVKWIPEGPYALQIQMGIALKEIAEEQDRVLDLRSKIKRKFGTAGLHVAQVTQAGITSELLNRLVQIYRDPTEVRKWLEHFLAQVEDLVIFVKEADNPKATATMVCTRIESNPAHTMILFGSGYAKNTVIRTLRVIKDEPRGYGMDGVDKGLELTVFIYTPEVKARISSWLDPFTAQ